MHDVRTYAWMCVGTQTCRYTVCGHAMSARDSGDSPLCPCVLLKEELEIHVLLRSLKRTYGIGTCYCSYTS